MYLYAIAHMSFGPVYPQFTLFDGCWFYHTGGCRIQFSYEFNQETADTLP